MICDFAQYYHVLDLFELHPTQAATLAVGLPPESRTKMAQCGDRISLKTALSAIIADNTAIIAWLLSKDGQDGINRPESLLKKLTEPVRPGKPNLGFSSAEDFDRMRKNIILSGG